MNDRGAGGMALSRSSTTPALNNNGRFRRTCTKNAEFLDLPDRIGATVIDS
jgi:hypothetical protein